MPFLFIGSTGDKAGHTLITWALAKALVNRGFRPGFLKPFGTNPIRAGDSWTDTDTLLFKKVLALEAPLENLCPHPPAPDNAAAFAPEALRKEMADRASKLALDSDILLVMGSTHMFLDDTSHPAPDISLVNRLEADLLVVHRYRKLSTTRYSLFSISSLLKDRLKGIVINRVPPANPDLEGPGLAQSFFDKKIPITAIIPEDPGLSHQTLGGVARVLGAEFISGEDALETTVGAMTVGSAVLPPELSIFKRVYHKLILLEPEVDGASPGGLAGILITGGANPAPGIIEAARKAGVPLLSATPDTFTCIDRLEYAAGMLSPDDEYKVDIVLEAMEAGGGVDRLLSEISL